ncbi:MAG: hypothetical protein KC582_00225 [Candidatus Magasanikbacteria bacterium]|nr:hypothetical protein [Candidatus Magasanikbacteria bacterium]MCA9390673.1 hypothetical protein [Candidatus Magasanikbacteria bacterium]
MQSALTEEDSATVEKLTWIYNQTYPRLRKVGKIITLDVDAQRSFPLSEDTDGYGTAYMIYGLLQYLKCPDILFCLTIANAKYRKIPLDAEWFIRSIEEDHPNELAAYCSKYTS